METNVRERAGIEGRWDLVAEKMNARLTEMKNEGAWSGKKKDLELLLGPHEHNIRRLRNGEPWNHDDAVRARISRGLGWSADGIDRLALGDESGAEVVEADEDRPPEAPFAAAGLGYDERISRLDPEDVDFVEAAIAAAERRKGLR